MRLTVVLLLVVLAVVFAAQNANVVSLSLFAWRADASLAVIIVLCFAGGAALACLILAPGIYRRSSDQRKLRRRIAELEGGAPAEQVGTPDRRRDREASAGQQ